MSVVTIEFELTKWRLIALCALCALAAVIADVDLTSGWHDARDIQVTVDGQAMSLQDALDARKLTCGSAPKAETAAHADYANNADRLGGRLVGDYCK